MLARANLSADPLQPAPSANLRPTALSLFTGSIIAGITKTLCTHAIKDAALQGNLFLSCDGSYQPTSKLAACSWTVTVGTKLGEGSGRLDTAFNSLYRAELYGILASLIILKHVEQTSEAIQGSVTIVSDCQWALRQALTGGPAGVKTATQDEYDVILAIHHVQSQLTIQINLMWVESHCTSDLSEEQQLNMEAYQLAISRLKSSSHQTLVKGEPLSLTLTVLHEDNIITAGLPQQILTNIHYDPLCKKILKGVDY